MFAAGLYGVARSPAKALWRLALAPLSRPLTVFAMLIGLSVVLYLPMFWIYGRDYWLSFGPFTFQASRPFFYGTYFLLGVIIGPRDLDRGLLIHNGSLARWWLVWCAAAVAAFVMLVIVDVNEIRIVNREGTFAFACAFVTISAISAAASSFTFLAVFLQFAVSG